MEAKDRIIVALDVSNAYELSKLVGQLAPHVGLFKIGLELITAIGGPAAVQAVHAAGGRVMYDAKFYDIPNTMAGAVRAAAAMGIELFTVHASNSSAALVAAAEAKGAAKMLGVTVLTSMSEADSRDTFALAPINAVHKFCRRARAAGADGVVCSPQELEIISDRQCLKVIPGIRPEWAAANDQKRVMTPGEAIKAGADYLVIGRPILKPQAAIGSPVEAAKRIADEIAA